MRNGIGSAAVALGGVAQIHGRGEASFLKDQLLESRRACAAAAGRLIVACASGASPAELGYLAHQSEMASAELRMAARALELSRE